MEKLVVEGGRPLIGSIPVSGAKNAALPILIATLVAPGEHRLGNIPDLADTSSTLSLLGRIGCPSLVNGVVRIDTSRVAFSEAPYDVVRKMRASVLVLGPLLARTGEAKVSLPGGCAIGTRPIDQHLKGLEALGCRFELSGGYIHGTVHDLRGADIHLDMPTVTGTENIVMAAVLARGTTRITNAAREPEVSDLCDFLVTLGAKIEGIGTSTLIIEGVPRLTPASRPYRIVPDRIEAGTYLCAAAATGGDVTLTGVDPKLMEATLAKLVEAGCDVRTTEDTIRLTRSRQLLPIKVRTEPFPGFPTDMQAQLMTLACFSKGTSTFEETIFENRYMHAAELLRMGADIQHAGRVATVRGNPPLKGAAVMASDLRASAALVIAGLAAEGITEVLRIYHLDRGYENLVGKLRAVGARIARVSDTVQDPAKLKAALDDLGPSVAPAEA
ncbi:MAG: UDP-N-acetylglucosamine 1-carboxyvinyltransferase [Alphaproteobacteria bacterium]|nr:UDP-N-acetylglucosamine 1-carboxyvinyltransferase [Alphaproteobacteria bacterium]MCB9697904.1 UDP-N-acetylglucosamine 1-carboxyvinyltransferase [Alphaproteobacteria bacterium]